MINYNWTYKSKYLQLYDTPSSFICEKFKNFQLFCNPLKSMLVQKRLNSVTYSKLKETYITLSYKLSGNRPPHYSIWLLRNPHNLHSPSPCIRLELSCNMKYTKYMKWNYITIFLCKTCQLCLALPPNLEQILSFINQTLKACDLYVSLPSPPPQQGCRQLVPVVSVDNLSLVRLS